MKLFDIVNKSNRGHYIVAENEEDARKVFAHLYPKSTVKDVAEMGPMNEDTGYKSLKKILAGIKKGQLAKQVIAMDFRQFANDVLLPMANGKDPRKQLYKDDHWFFLKEVT